MKTTTVSISKLIQLIFTVCIFTALGIAQNTLSIDVGDGTIDVLYNSDDDIGGLVGIHLREEMNIGAPVISIDGITLSEFDYIDIGKIIPSSGAVPVVIKSLVFPASTTITQQTKS